MRYKLMAFALFLSSTLVILPPAGIAQKKLLLEKNTEPATTNADPVVIRPHVLWENPTDIQSRNLYYGAGGEKHQPHPDFTFTKEDMEGTNPKFDVEDSDGTKWKVKIGIEARPETTATRFVWAVGYFTADDYYFPEIHVKNMQHMKRGQNFVSGDVVRHVRLKRTPGKKTDTWSWLENPYTGTRELNGLRVMMALINNWDLKDENNAVYEVKHKKAKKDGEEKEGDKDGDSDAEEKDTLRYEISDLGASFGAPNLAFPFGKSKDNLKAYRHSKFIDRTNATTVDFKNPSGPAFIYSIFHHHDASEHQQLRWIGKQIPREDAKWIGQLLAQLTPEQIHDAFRAGGYSSQEIEAFSAVIQARIAELNRL